MVLKKKLYGCLKIVYYSFAISALNWGVARLQITLVATVTLLVLHTVLTMAQIQLKCSVLFNVLREPGEFYPAEI